MENNILMDELLRAAAGRGKVQDIDGFVAGCKRFFELLLAANATTNLTRIVVPEEFAIKHVADSLLLAEVCPAITSQPYALLDIGCGAGVPSIILALAYPDLQVFAMDSVGKKTAFVKMASCELGLKNVAVITGRSCELNRVAKNHNKYDIITARAVAESRTICQDSRKMIKPAGKFYFYKTPEQVLEELPVIRKAIGDRGWRSSETFELPNGAGYRQFIYG